MDLGMDEWKEISGVCKSGGLLPFFDMAYQGLGQENGEDAAAVRLFAEEGHEMVVACTQSKNFGLYSERVGAVYFVTGSEESARKVGSKVKNDDPGALSPIRRRMGRRWWRPFWERRL